MERDITKLLDKIQGIHTLESIITLLDIDRIKAVKLISKLRKKGYVKTKRLSNNKRVYDISFENRLGGINYIDVLNDNSPVKLVVKDIPWVYGRSISLEEVLVNTLKSKSVRQMTASLALFKKINNWSFLYGISKKENLERVVGAFYDLSRRIMKTRKMAKIFLNNSLPKKGDKYVYAIDGLSSDDFKDIEKKWKVYIPFNKSDLEEYK